jgi:hypothetical protein
MMPSSAVAVSSERSPASLPSSGRRLAQIEAVDAAVALPPRRSIQPLSQSLSISRVSVIAAFPSPGEFRLLQPSVRSTLASTRPLRAGDAVARRLRSARRAPSLHLAEREQEIHIH